MLPFVAAPIGVYIAAEPAAMVGPAVAAYGLAIVSFLAGSWWGIALLRRDQGVLIASNLVVITAWLGFVLLDPQANLLLQALLLVGAVGLERIHPIFRPQPAYYARLRTRLSVVASLALVVSVLVW